MSDKLFKIVLITIGVFFVGFVFAQSNSEPQTRPGIEHEDEGREHVSLDEAPDYNGGEPPASGAHGAAVPKGYYENELPDYNTIHNLEHGYIYVSYKPDLPQEEIEKLRMLFFEPYSNPSFKPTKVIMAPRANNDSPIILSSWQRSQKFDSYDEQAMIDYYLSNVNKSPEPLAQ